MILEIITFTELTGRRLIFEGKAEEAVPAALQCLKFTVDLYGLATLDRLYEAEAYLAQAQWTFLKLQHACSNSIRSQVFRKLGLFYKAKKDYDAALEALAQDLMRFKIL
ncbi:unnamed protein product [Protopolystoma xenopodis]|uniref:Uncharacterized protein n=1 Tax=Protopolystoma xenopodis TaxID=117903 RepID=A0A3S5C561_9PLAT|nr:unnamed protein product [Protopolystoma xenopodis]